MKPAARVVVVSALAGVTDTLLRIGDTAASDAGRARADLAALTGRHRGVAASIGDAHRRQVLDAGIDGIAQSADRTVQAIAAQGAQTAALRDRLLATGELWSSRLIAAFLTEAGIASQWLDARNVIRTDARHGNAAPDLVATEDALDRMARPSLAVGRVVVLAGFIGSAEGHQTTTLGRGGSDYSAAVIGACLNASAIEIWTDVDGVLSADPRVVARARVLPALSYEDAHVLATFGAKVLHPKTIEPAAARGIPVHVRNSSRPDEPGTRIDAHGSGDGKFAAVASRGGVNLVEISARDRSGCGSFAARALQSLADAGVSVVAGEVSGGRLTVAVDQSFEMEAFQVRVGAFADVRMRAGLAAVCAVGDGVRSDPRLVSDAFAALDDAPIHLVSRPHRSTGLAVIVDGADAHRVVMRLHDHFSHFSHVSAGENVGPAAVAIAPALR